MKTKFQFFLMFLFLLWTPFGFADEQPSLEAVQSLVQELGEATDPLVHTRGKTGGGFWVPARISDPNFIRFAESLGWGKKRFLLGFGNEKEIIRRIVMMNDALELRHDLGPYFKEALHDIEVLLSSDLPEEELVRLRTMRELLRTYVDELRGLAAMNILFDAKAESIIDGLLSNDDFVDNHRRLEELRRQVPYRKVLLGTEIGEIQDDLVASAWSELRAAAPSVNEQIRKVNAAVSWIGQRAHDEAEFLMGAASPLLRAL